MNTATTATVPAPATSERRRESLWSKAAWKFRRDRAGMAGLAVVLLYFIAALGVWTGFWGTGWADIGGGKWSPCRQRTGSAPT